MQARGRVREFARGRACVRSRGSGDRRSKRKGDGGHRGSGCLTSFGFAHKMRAQNARISQNVDQGLF